MELAPVKIKCPECNMPQTGYIEYNNGVPFIKCGFTRCGHLITGHEFGITTRKTIKGPGDLRLA